MRKNSLLFSLMLLLSLCQPTPETGRRQLNLVSEEELFKLSFEQYQEYLNTHQVITGTEDADLVRIVGGNIQKAVEQYYKDNPEKLKRYRWEFNLIEDTSINAFAMPGGKVAVLSPILPVTKNGAGLAFVIGHEAAHSVANHANERLSQLLLAELGGMVLSEALQKQPQKTRELALAAYGLGAQVGIILPYSRIQEEEADRLGLIFMAMAGYDPQESIGFLERMIQIQKGQQSPEFLSTHPAEENRIEKIKEYLPEAMKYYKSPK
jgi:predicted Zn-dependent protease